MRCFPLLLLATCLAACSGNDKWAENVETPPLNMMAEAPGDWSALHGMIGRTPSESGLIENSPISVDLNARLGGMARPYRNNMMRAGALTRRDDLLVSVGPDAWLVIDPAGRAFRAGLRTREGWREWATAGASVPSLSLR